MAEKELATSGTISTTSEKTEQIFQKYVDSLGQNAIYYRTGVFFTTNEISKEVYLKIFGNDPMGIKLLEEIAFYQSGNVIFEYQELDDTDEILDMIADIKGKLVVAANSRFIACYGGEDIDDYLMVYVWKI